MRSYRTLLLKLVTKKHGLNHVLDFMKQLVKYKKKPLSREACSNLFYRLEIENKTIKYLYLFVTKP